MSDSPWDFPPGTVGADQSLKGYRADAKDGRAGQVSWCDYAPGESFLVVAPHPHLGGKHHVVPAGAVASVDHGKRIVLLHLTKSEFDALPIHDESKQIDSDYINRFEIGWLRGGGGYAPDPDS